MNAAKILSQQSRLVEKHALEASKAVLKGKIIKNLNKKKDSEFSVILRELKNINNHITNLYKIPNQYDLPLL
jgi:hypothetical protein